MEEPTEIYQENHIQLVRKIASGGMGTVYEGRQIGFGGFQKKMAIKTINEDVAADKSFVEMFIGEAKLVADLIHENIAQVYQLGKVGNTFYIAMEYIDGIHLQEFNDRHARQKQKIPIELCCFIISRVCRALHYAHTKRDQKGELLCVVHRDVSPKNIMLSFDGIVKLTDFGVAKTRNLLFNSEGEILYGNAPYMSPEQAGFAKTDGRSDIFSLGICFYEILAGNLLFGNDTTSKTRFRIIREEVPPIRHFRPDIPEKVEQILYKALEKNRNRRYQIAQRMGFDLEHFLYDKGYGPTNTTLQDYLLELYSDKRAK